MFNNHLGIKVSPYERSTIYNNSRKQNEKGISTHLRNFITENLEVFAAAKPNEVSKMRAYTAGELKVNPTSIGVRLSEKVYFELQDIATNLNVSMSNLVFTFYKKHFNL